MRTITAALTLSALALCSSSIAAGEAWYDDFDVATEAAKKEGKDLLVDFTGSDWCVWCVRLHDEVFGHEEFVTAVSEDFILVALDFPRDEAIKAEVPNPERNKELQKKHGVRGFPTVLLMNADGEVYAQTGYQAGGVEPYLEHLGEIRAAGLEALAGSKKIVAAFEAAEGDAKVAAWEQAIALLAKLDGGSPFAPKLAIVARWALESDPDNERGFKLLAVEALMKAGQADPEVLQAARELDPKNEKGLLEQSVQAQFQGVQDDVTARAAIEALEALVPFGFQDQKIGFELQFYASQWCNGPLADPERAKKFAAGAKAIGTDDAKMLEALEGILAG
jgi:thioredoxin-related protein